MRNQRWLYRRMLASIVLKKYYNMPQTVISSPDILEKGYVPFFSMIYARLIWLLSGIMLTRTWKKFGARNGIEFKR